jgi:pyruvate formate lyase activating enzyme
VLDNLGNNTPIHFSAYHPDFKGPSEKRTPYKTLDIAYHIAKDLGLYFPYVGNINHEQGSNTFCPNCGHLLFERRGYTFKKIDIADGKKCPNCAYDLRNDIVGEINQKASHRFSFY